MRRGALRRAIDASEYDVLVVINLDPTESEGGQAIPEEQFVYMGNFKRWRGPLDFADWRSVVRAVYHHEVAHLWGWRHDWSRRCREGGAAYAPFVAAPVLFGWEDVDGDGLAEILDSTPYGRVQ